MGASGKGSGTSRRRALELLAAAVPAVWAGRAAAQSADAATRPAQAGAVGAGAAEARDAGAAAGDAGAGAGPWPSLEKIRATNALLLEQLAKAPLLNGDAPDALPRPPLPAGPKGRK